MNHWNHHLTPGFIVRGLIAIAVLGCPAVPGGAANPNPSYMVIWYRQPATACAMGAMGLQWVQWVMQWVQWVGAMGAMGGCNGCNGWVQWVKPGAMGAMVQWVKP